MIIMIIIAQTSVTVEIVLIYDTTRHMSMSTLKK